MPRITSHPIGLGTLVALLLAAGPGTAIRAEEAKPERRSWPISFTEPVRIDVKSRGVEWNRHTYHLVRLEEAGFSLKDGARLTGTLSAWITTFDRVDYEVHVAVFDERGRLLGTAKDTAKVERVWLGKVLSGRETLAFDFGASDAYPGAQTFTVAISERKVLTPDDWQK